MLFKVARFISLTVRCVSQWNMETKTIVFGLLAAVLWLYFGFSLFLTSLAVSAVYLATGGHRFVAVAAKTCKRDVSALYVFLKAKRMMAKYKESGETIPSLFQKTVRKHPNKIAFGLVDGSQLTFREVDELSNQVANYFYEIGYRKGDAVALFMESSPEYVCMWLGLAKIGAVPALINFNLRMNSMAHCIAAAEAKAVIYTDTLAQAIADSQTLLGPSTKMFCYGKYDADVVKGATHLNPLLDRSSRLQPPNDHKTGFNEKLFFIYTSGTTGLPKAAIVVHSRFFYMAYSLHQFFFTGGADDVLYDILPLYHTAGGVLGVGQALIMGCTVIIKPKFSASRFWDDCMRYNCTTTQYIGEIARYLLAQPVRAVERQHRVRMAFGNGLRPQIWCQYMERFGITTIGEFYGATEGNANIVNTDNKVGAVGFLSMIAPSFYPVCLIRVDEVTGEPLRDSNGMCIKSKPGQPGELVGKIIKGDPLREFDGYADKKATSKKIATNVFKKGDAAFLTGDVLEMDELGYLFFKDRTGDTFRWRGENVSTAEVEATVSNVVKLNDAVCYGVEVPGVEGKAGMVAIVDEKHQLDLQHLHQNLKKVLPAYAVPVFIRLLEQVDTTGTFKLKKTDYKLTGFDPSKTKDHMFYYDAKKAGYIAIDQQVHDDICNGKIRV